ncbi:MAG: hypothetical protein CBE07_001565 [Pelagibacteraceae bacterium TMED247]|nr:MAG: hypothetical protein CBE07_001565 [Pelagibacteraceae bacterium TMED247]|tara:strand:+ start:2935 stop:3192 length:258 start_codon:yes stop_codon:yes gene_type:complete
MKKIDINRLSSRKEVMDLVRELDLTWKKALSIENPRKRSKELLKLSRLISIAIEDVKREYNNDYNSRQACRYLQKWLAGHRNLNG